MSDFRGPCEFHGANVIAAGDGLAALPAQLPGANQCAHERAEIGATARARALLSKRSFAYRALHGQETLIT